MAGSDWHDVTAGRRGSEDIRSHWARRGGGGARECLRRRHGGAGFPQGTLHIVLPGLSCCVCHS